MPDQLRAVFDGGGTLTASADAPGRARGTIVPWDTPGRTSRGPVRIRRGAIALPDDLARVKLTVEHDDARPVGILEAADDTDAGLVGVFRYGTTPAALTAAAELADRTREGLSVDLVDVVIEDGVLTAGYLKAVSQVAIPAYDDARALAAAHHNRREEAPMETDTAQAAPADDAPARDRLTAAADAPAPSAPAAVQRTAARTRPASAAAELADRLIASRFAGGDAATVSTLTAALADITPAGNGAGHELAGLAVQAAGELADTAYAPVYDRAVAGMRLTGMEITGWHWDTKPGVGDYAGNKADIPTGPAALKSITATAQRIAGGHDLDRIYIDLGSRDVLVGYWRLMAEDVQRQLDAKRLAAVQAAAGSPAAAAGLGAAIIDGATTVAGANYVLVAGDLMREELSKPASELAALFTGPSITGQTVPPVTVAPDLTGTVIVGRRDAVRFYTVEPPLRFEAVHIAKGGVDAGIFTYWAALPSPFGGVKAYTVAAAAAE